ncbi:MAG: Xaa-Pro peptidase family protein [Pseudomonadota bacterium]
MPKDSHNGLPTNVERGTLRRERLARLKAEIVKADCAAGVFLDPINIRYATDVSNMQVWCLHNPVRYSYVAADGPVLHFEFPSCNHLAEGIETIDEVRPAQAATYLMAGPEVAARAKAWAAELADLVRQHGGGNRRLAVDRLDWTSYLALQDHGIEAVDGQAVAEQARRIKTPQELVAIRESVAACEAAVETMRAAIRPGLTEQQVWSVLHRENISGGGEWIETRLLASGPRTNPWYQECSERVIEPGDLVALDTDLIGRHGYCSDISRTWRAGEGRASDRQRRTYAQARAHLERLMEVIRPGLSLDEIAGQVGDPPEDYHVYSCLLHGIGLCDEYPVAFWRNQAERYQAVLEPGMTICVESYFGPRHGGEGVKLEQQVLVTENGLETLSRLPFEEDWM